MHKFAGAIALSLALVCFISSVHGLKMARVLLISAADPSIFPNILNQAQTELTNTGKFCRVDQWDTVKLNGLPTLAQVNKYDAVVVYSYVPSIDNINALGDLLADYVDNGGGVVWMVSQYNMGGRFQSGDYSPFTYAERTIGSLDTKTEIVTAQADHPILKGVSNFPYYYTSNVYAGNNALVLINQDQSTSTDPAYVFCAVKQGLANGKVVGLNMYPFAENSPPRSPFWFWPPTDTNPLTLLVNAIKYVRKTA